MHNQNTMSFCKLSFVTIKHKSLHYFMTTLYKEHFFKMCYFWKYYKLLLTELSQGLKKNMNGKHAFFQNKSKQILCHLPIWQHDIAVCQ